jgi:serine/threonine protein kinase
MLAAPPPLDDDLIQLIRTRLAAPGTADDLDTLAAGGADTAGVLEELVRRGALTRYQANNIAKGKAKSLLFGSYVLLERLGSGGWGRVYKARHVQMRHFVALKVLLGDRRQENEAVRRFGREVRAAAQLSHPNAVRAIDAGRLGDVDYFVMEYVEGTDLLRAVKHNGPPPVERAIDIIRQAALGLHHAHECGLVHRDVKPSNLLLTADGVVKVGDFGLSRRVTGSGSEVTQELTRTGEVLGTADYLAPEQAIDFKSIDHRADVYSLGCTFYYVLTGRPPFPGEGVAAKLIAHQIRQPTPVNELRPEVPPGVAAVLSRMIAKEPEDRFQSMAEVAAALDAGQPPPPPAPPPAPPPPARVGASLAVWAAVGVAALGAGAGLAWLLLGG